MAEFEFNAMRDELLKMKREILDLKRFAPSGVVTTNELRMSTNTGSPVTFDGPTGGMLASVVRINQWADVHFTGIVTSVAGTSGPFALQLPWPVVGAHPSQYTRLGTFDCNAGGVYGAGVIYVLGNTSVASNVTLWYDVPGGQAQVTTVAPGTWAAGSTIRGELRARIAPGF